MMPLHVRNGLAVTSILAAVLVLPSTARAHVTKAVGPLRLALGWGDEPPVTGAKNFVEVGLATASGAPVLTRSGSLSVEVSFGRRRIVLPLVPAEQPGELRGALVPTRPGTYTFHVMGLVRARTIDVTSSCSEKTFDCVVDASELEFPVKDPSAGQLAARLTRAMPRAEDAVDRARGAHRLAIAALVAAGLALAALVALAVGVRAKGA